MLMMMMELRIVSLIEIEANDKIAPSPSSFPVQLLPGHFSMLDIAASPSPFPVQLPHYSDLDKLHEGRGPLSVCLTNKVELECAHLQRGPYHAILHELCILSGFFFCMSHLNTPYDPLYLTMQHCLFDCHKEGTYNGKRRTKCFLQCYEKHIKVHSDHDVISKQKA